MSSHQDKNWILWFLPELPGHVHCSPTAITTISEENGNRDDGGAEDHSAGAGPTPGDDAGISSCNPPSPPLLQTPGESQDKGSAERPPIRGRDSTGSQLEARPTLVGDLPQPLQRETTADHPVGTGRRVRCITERVGSQLSGDFLWRPLDGSRKDPPYKLPQATGCVSGTEMLCFQQESGVHSTPTGQRDGHCLSQQNGWDPCTLHSCATWQWKYGSGA